MERGCPPDIFERLAQIIGMPVVACVSGWRNDIAVDLDELAARQLLDVLDGFRQTDGVALVLIGRGATPGFADLVRRAARHIELRIIVPFLVNGRVGLAAVSGATLELGRYGAVGAIDAPFAASTLRPPAVKQLGRRIVGADVSSLMSAELGAGQGLTADELSAIGVTAQDLPEDIDDVAWELFQAYESSLGLHDGPTRRYEESEVGDEVEWEFAVGVPGAFIESFDHSFAYLLDTGKPDPDTGQFEGAWAGAAFDEVLELDFDNAQPA